VAQRGNGEALDLLLGNCEDMSEAVRRASIEALTRISNKGDVAVTEAALKLVDDPDASVRKQVRQISQKRCVRVKKDPQKRGQKDTY